MGPAAFGREGIGMRGRVAGGLRSEEFERREAAQKAVRERLTSLGDVFRTGRGSNGLDRCACIGRGPLNGDEMPAHFKNRLKV